jgi:rRNA-processing protein FCF1
MNSIEASEKNKILKEALKIVDKLAKSDLADLDIAIPDSTYEELEVLINRARKLKKNRYWDLT